MEVIKFILSILKWILTALAIIMLLGLLFGYRLYILESDSMSPRYPKGSIVVLDSRSTVEEIKIGDIVGVMVGNSRVFHRVVDIVTPTEADPSLSSLSSSSGASLPPSNPLEQDSAMMEHVYRLASDRDPSNWTDVKIIQGNLLGKMAFSLPGIGAMTILLIRRPWLSWLVAFLITLLVMIPWKRIIEKIHHNIFPSKHNS